MITQKITGFLFIIFITFLFLIFSSKSKVILKIFFSSLLLSFIYFLFHYVITGIPFYETSDVRMFGTDIVGIINTYAPLSILYKIDLIDAWVNPLRDSQWLSMWNILIIDFYGDYWNSGFFKKTLVKVKYLNVENIGRISIINSLIFFLVCLYTVLTLRLKY